MAWSPLARRLTTSGSSPFEKGTSTGPFLLSQAPASSGPKWKLGSIANPPRGTAVDPIVFRASECFVSVSEGKTLVSELQGLIKKQPGITVEAFEFEKDFLSRRSQLTGGPVGEVNG